MATALTAFKVVGTVASAMSARAQAMNQAATQELQAKLADTQALQRDTIAREELMRAESSVRAARGANGLSGLSPNALLLWGERQDASDRDRQIAVADSRQRAANFRSAAKYSRSVGRMSLLTGAVKSAVPLAQFAQFQGGS